MMAFTIGGRASRARDRVPVETVERVLSLYREKYFDFNVRHFHEKLREEEGITLSYMWVKLALQGAGLVKIGTEARDTSQAASAPSAARYAVALGRQRASLVSG